jgi:vacuolar-type H+-ATPase subunit F/Vma7
VRIFVLAGPADVAGFALAGVEGRACARPGEAPRFARELRNPGEPPIGLLLFSPEAAREASSEVEEFSRRGTLPLVLVLPKDAEPGS